MTQSEEKRQSSETNFLCQNSEKGFKAAIVTAQ